MGPVTMPIAQLQEISFEILEGKFKTHIAPRMPDHFLLSTAETKSDTIRFDKMAMPPAPIP